MVTSQSQEMVMELALGIWHSQLVEVMAPCEDLNVGTLAMITGFSPQVQV
jgi:hypothetical protein